MRQIRPHLALLSALLCPISRCCLVCPLGGSSDVCYVHFISFSVPRFVPGSVGCSCGDRKGHPCRWDSRGWRASLPQQQLHKSQALRKH